MHPRVRESLLDILTATDYIARKIEPASLDEYLANEDLRSLIERNLITIGEAIVRVRDDDPATMSRIGDFREAIGLRDVIVHGYKNVSDAQIWEMIGTFLPVLAVDVRRLLAEDS